MEFSEVDTPSSFLNARKYGVCYLYFYELPARLYLARQIELHTVSDSEQNFTINHLPGSAQIL